MDKDLIIESLTKQVADLTALVQTLTKSNADLTETIKELQRQLNQTDRRMRCGRSVLLSEEQKEPG
jgi:prefoldin subunit 5